MSLFTADKENLDFDISQLDSYAEFLDQAGWNMGSEDYEWMGENMSQILSSPKNMEYSLPSAMSNVYGESSIPSESSADRNDETSSSSPIPRPLRKGAAKPRKKAKGRPKHDSDDVQSATEVSCCWVFCL